MRQVSSTALLIALIGCTVVMWVQARWAVSIAEISAFTLAAAWLLASVIAGVRLRLHFVLFALGAMVAWGVVQARLGITVYPPQTWDKVLYWSAILAFFFAALQSFSEPEIRRRFLRALLWFGFVTAIVSTLQALTVNAKVYWLFQTDYTRWNVFGPFVYHNQYAAFINLILPIALYYAFTDAKKRILYLFMAAAMYASIVACGSRAGFVLATGELLWVPMVTNRRHRGSRRPLLRAAGVLAGMIVLLALAVGPDILIGKLDAPDPFAVRREYNISSLAMIKARPLTGFGLGAWPTAYPGYAVVDNGMFANQAHDDWAQWAAEGGLPFAAVLLAIALWAIPRGLNSGWGAGIAAVFLHCFVDYPVQRLPVALTLFAVVAAVSHPFGRESGGEPSRRRSLSKAVPAVVQ
jgi:hypothetical protein